MQDHLPLLYRTEFQIILFCFSQSVTSFLNSLDFLPAGTMKGTMLIINPFRVKGSHIHFTADTLFCLLHTVLLYTVTVLLPWISVQTSPLLKISCRSTCSSMKSNFTIQISPDGSLWVWYNNSIGLQSCMSCIPHLRFMSLCPY